MSQITTSPTPKIIYCSHLQNRRQDHVNDILFPELYIEVVDQLLDPLAYNPQYERHFRVQTILRKKHADGKHYSIKFQQNWHIPLYTFQEPEKNTLDYLHDAITRINIYLYRYLLEPEEFKKDHFTSDTHPYTEYMRVIEGYFPNEKYQHPIIHQKP